MIKTLEKDQIITLVSMMAAELYMTNVIKGADALVTWQQMYQANKDANPQMAEENLVMQKALFAGQILKRLNEPDITQDYIDHHFKPMVKMLEKMQEALDVGNK